MFFKALIIIPVIETITIVGFFLHIFLRKSAFLLPESAQNGFVFWFPRFTTRHRQHACLRAIVDIADEADRSGHPERGPCGMLSQNPECGYPKIAGEWLGNGCWFPCWQFHRFWPIHMWFLHNFPRKNWERRSYHEFPNHMIAYHMNFTKAFWIHEWAQDVCAHGWAEGTI